MFFSFSSDNEEFFVSENPIAARQSSSDELADHNRALHRNYEEYFAGRSEDLQSKPREGITEDMLEETSPQVESLLRRSSMTNEEKRSVIETFLKKFLPDPTKRALVARSMMRRSTTTASEMRNTLIYSIKRYSVQLDEKRNSVRALVEALNPNESIQRRTLRFIFSKQPDHSSYAESDSFLKVQDDVSVLVKENEITKDKTRANIESILRASTLSEDEKELIIDRVLRKNVLDTNKRRIFGNSMIIRSSMSTDERNHNIIKILGYINVSPAQKSDIITVILEDFTSDYDFSANLNQYNVESAINALTFQNAAAHNFRETQESSDLHNRQANFGSCLESQACVKSQSVSNFKPYTTVETYVSGGENYDERHKPVRKNNLDEFSQRERERTPSSYQVYQFRNNRSERDAWIQHDLKTNVFPENSIYASSDANKLSGKYKKNVCPNPTCTVHMRNEARQSEGVLKEFFHIISDESITSDGRRHGEQCNCIYRKHDKHGQQLNENMYTDHEIFDGQNLDNLASRAPIQLKQKKSIPNEMFSYENSKNTGSERTVYDIKPSKQESRLKFEKEDTKHAPQLSRSKLSLANLFSRSKSVTPRSKSGSKYGDGSEMMNRKKSNINTNAGSVSENNALKMERSKSTLYDGGRVNDKHDGCPTRSFQPCNKSCDSCCREQSRRHSEKPDRSTPSKPRPSHVSVNNELSSNNNSNVRSEMNEDCALCICLLIMKFLHKQWRALVSIETLRR